MSDLTTGKNQGGGVTFCSTWISQTLVDTF